MQSKGGFFFGCCCCCCFSGGNKLATMDQLAWGSCYNKEMNSNSNYCDEHYKKAYPCALGIAYFGRGALPIYWYLLSRPKPQMVQSMKKTSPSTCRFFLFDNPIHINHIKYQHQELS